MAGKESALLQRVGVILYGDRWQSDLARALNVDSRRVRAWSAEERPIPHGVWDDLLALLSAREYAITRVSRSVMDMASGRLRSTPSVARPKR